MTRTDLPSVRRCEQDLRVLLWIGIGGFFGAVARYGLGWYITERLGPTFPLGTFAANITGSLFLGFLATAGIDSGLGSGLISPTLHTAVTVGFLGAFTTFSTWSLETLRLLQAGQLGMAGLNVVGSVVAGLAGAWFGLQIGRLIS